MIHPCCGYPLQQATRIIAIVELVISVLYLLLNFVALSSHIPLALDERTRAEENPTENVPRIFGMLTVLVLLNTAYWITSLLLGVVLLVGAKQRDLRKCRTWFVVTCILTILYIVEIMMEAFSMRSSPNQIASPVVGSILQMYMLWVVSAFMDELRLGGSLPIKNQPDVADV